MEQLDLELVPMRDPLAAGSGLACCIIPPNWIIFTFKIGENDDVNIIFEQLSVY